MLRSSILFLGFFLISYSIIAQEAPSRFKAGLMLGLNTSQVSGDNLSGFNKAGIIGGGFVRTAFNDMWGAQMEMVYTMKGSRKVPKPEEGNANYTLRLNYVEIPVLLKVKLKRLSYDFGPSVGVLISDFEELNSQEISYANRPFKRTEVSLIAGAAYSIKDNIEFTVRLTNSVIPIRDHANGATFTWNTGQYNSVLSFAFHYRFQPAPSA